MPAVRRRAKVKREDYAELTKEQRRHLMYGHTFFGKGYSDRESFAIGWEIHGEAVTKDFIAKLPGRRPFGWWLLEHKKERPILLPSEESRVRKQQSEYYPQKFGFLCTSQTGFGGWFQEPQDEYLHRNGLLTVDEIAEMNRE